MNRHFSEEDIQVVNRQMKRCSTLFIIREIQIQTAMTYHFIPIRIATVKRKEKNKCGEDVENLKSLCTVGVYIKCGVATVKNSWQFLKNL